MPDFYLSDIPTYQICCLRLICRIQIAVKKQHKKNLRKHPTKKGEKLRPTPLQDLSQTLPKLWTSTKFRLHAKDAI